MSETYKLLLPLQFHSIYSLLPFTLFSLAINFFPPSHLLNSLAIHLVTLTLLPLLPKSVSLLTARFNFACIYYTCFNLHPSRILIAAFTLHREWLDTDVVIGFWKLSCCCKLKKSICCVKILYTLDCPLFHCPAVALAVTLCYYSWFLLTLWWFLLSCLGSHLWLYPSSCVLSSWEVWGCWDPTLMGSSDNDSRMRRYFPWHFPGFLPASMSFPLGHISLSPLGTAACFSISSNPVYLQLHTLIPDWQFWVGLELSISFLWSCFSGRDPIMRHERPDRYTIRMEVAAWRPPYFFPLHQGPRHSVYSDCDG